MASDDTAPPLEQDARDPVAAADGLRAADEYDAMREVYAEHADAGAFNAVYDRPTILELAGEIRGRDVLDLGCAAGALTEALVERGAHATGVDVSEEMVALARRRLGGRARFIRADLGAPLDMLPDREFDVVVASLVLHYLRDWTPTLREVVRVLRADGRFIMSTHHPGASFQASPAGTYFATELIEDRWEKAGRSFSVHSYRRPLSAVLSPIIEAGLIIDAVVEPEPAAEWRLRYPDLWRRVSSGPWFLFIRARTPADGGRERPTSGFPASGSP